MNAFFLEINVGTVNVNVVSSTKEKYIQHGFMLCFTADLCYYDQFKSTILYLSFVPDPFSRRKRKEWGHDDMKEV